MALFSFFSRQPKQTKANRRRAHLTVDTLEDRATPSANTISGNVYHDANNNGLIDSGEAPIANVALQLKNNATNQIVATATSDQAGFYQFANDSTVPTTPTSLTKTVSFPETDTNFDLSGEVDQFDPALGVLNSIEVVHDGSITSSIQVENTSRTSGSTITGTVSGNLNLVAPGVSDVLTMSQNAGSLSVAKYDNALDFGGGSGGNLGTKTATGNKTITLTGSSLTGWQGKGKVTVHELATATSNASGGGNVTAAITSSGRSTITVRYNYIPSNGLQPGTYTIIETQPTGYLDGKDALNGVPINNSIGSDTIVVTLANTSLTGNNFGELQDASLSGFVYVDANDNGVKDAEQPISGVTITLTGFTSDGPVSKTATTDASGSYQFTNLKPGTYGLQEGNPGSQYVDGKDTIGSQGGATGNDSFTSIALGSGVNGVNNNFGEILPAKVSGAVYFDTNENGLFDSSETGIANVTITLTTDGSPARTTTTDATGGYQFTGLRPGTYSIAETQPSGYKDGQENLGTSGGTVGSDLFTGIVLAGGASGEKYNFGELRADEADVGIVKTASALQSNVGDTLTYTLTVTNYGAYVAKDLSVVDTLPSGAALLGASGLGWSVATDTGKFTATMPSLAVGASSTITVQIRVPAVSSTITNTATVSSSTPDKNPTNNTGSVTTSVNIPTPAITGLIGTSFGAAGKNNFFTDTVAQYAADLKNSALVSGLYQTILNRVPDASGNAYLLSLLRKGASAAQVTSILWNSDEHRDKQADQIYQSVLGRTPTASERFDAASNLKAGASEAAVARQLYTSAEYLSQHPGSADLAGSLYVRLTGALPSAAQSASALQAMANSPLDQVVANIQQSDDALRNSVRTAYRTVLRRNAGDAEVTYWVNRLKFNGVSEGDLYQTFLSSEEFRTLANKASVKK